MCLDWLGSLRIYTVFHAKLVADYPDGTNAPFRADVGLSQRMKLVRPKRGVKLALHYLDSGEGLSRF